MGVEINLLQRVETNLDEIRAGLVCDDYEAVGDILELHAATLVSLTAPALLRYN